MSNRIFTNGEEGKILTSVGNRIIKQPYAFGNGIGSDYINVTNGIDFQEIGIGSNSDFTICGWVYKSPSFSGEIGILTLTAGDNSYFNLFLQSVGSLYLFNSINASFNNIDYTANKLIFVALMRENGVIKYMSNSGVVSFTSSTKDFKRLRIGLLRQSKVANVGIGNRLSYFIMYNRFLPYYELLYLKNNLLGSDPQSLSGLVSRWPINNAELVSVKNGSGGIVSAAGIVDLMGNNNGSLLDLPAGTLVEKVDYANANLFVPFLT